MRKALGPTMAGNPPAEASQPPGMNDGDRAHKGDDRACCPEQAQPLIPEAQEQEHENGGLRSSQEPTRSLGVTPAQWRIAQRVSRAELLPARRSSPKGAQ
jgi:hypothetical protein